MPEGGFPPSEPLRSRIQGLMDRSLARQAAMSLDALLPAIGERPPAVPERTGHISTPPTGRDRLLTEREAQMYKRIKGVYPKQGTTLGEFRRMMAEYRKRGGFDD